MRQTLLLFIILLNSSFLYSQQEEQNSFYFFNPLQFNPAYAGSRGNLHAVFINRLQWAGIKGAPITQFLSLNTPIGRENAGLGFHISNDKIGARNRTSFYADISGIIKLNNKNHKLALGLSPGLDHAVINFTNLTANNPEEIDILQRSSNTYFNFGAGLYYYGDKFFFGVSVPRILFKKKAITISENLTKPHLFIAGGYVFKLTSYLDFKPTALIKLTQGAPVTVDLNTSFFLYQKFWIGAMYRYNESAGVNFAYTIPKQKFTIGYAFDFPINNLNRLNNWGTHEIMLSFDLYRGKTLISPRYF